MLQIYIIYEHTTVLYIFIMYTYTVIVIYIILKCIPIYHIYVFVILVLLQIYYDIVYLIYEYLYCSFISTGTVMYCTDINKESKKNKLIYYDFHIRDPKPIDKFQFISFPYVSYSHIIINYEHTV